MKIINQTSEPKTSSSNKIIFFIILIVLAIFTYVLTKTPDKKSTKGFGSALYSGNSKSDGKEQPAKLKWSDSFKGINNMGNK